MRNEKQGIRIGKLENGNMKWETIFGKEVIKNKNEEWEKRNKKWGMQKRK